MPETPYVPSLYSKRKIWLLYGDDIIELERRDRVYVSSQKNSTVADFDDDDIPF